VRLEWDAPHWLLERTTTLAPGHWQKMDDPSPLTIPATPGIGFYRLRLP